LQHELKKVAHSSAKEAPMPDPTKPDEGWQQVPQTPVDPTVANAGPVAAGLSPTAAAAIAYLTCVPAIVFLVLDPYKRIPFVRFHAIQSIALFVVWVLVWIVLGIVFTPLMFAGAWGTMHLIGEIVKLAFLIGYLVAIIQASQGKWFKLPVVGDFALKQAQK
jgi:uncharacterized membrane protein